MFGLPSWRFRPCSWLQSCCSSSWEPLAHQSRRHQLIISWQRIQLFTARLTIDTTPERVHDVPRSFLTCDRNSVYSRYSQIPPAVFLRDEVIVVLPPKPDEAFSQHFSLFTGNHLELLWRRHVTGGRSLNINLQTTDTGLFRGILSRRYENQKTPEHGQDWSHTQDPFQHTPTRSWRWSRLQLRLSSFALSAHLKRDDGV